MSAERSTQKHGFVFEIDVALPVVESGTSLVRASESKTLHVNVNHARSVNLCCTVMGCSNIVRV